MGNDATRDTVVLTISRAKSREHACSTLCRRSPLLSTVREASCLSSGRSVRAPCHPGCQPCLIRERSLFLSDIFNIIGRSNFLDPQIGRPSCLTLELEKNKAPHYRGGTCSSNCHVRSCSVKARSWSSIGKGSFNLPSSCEHEKQ